MGIELDCSDIIEIFKTHLKIDNSVKSIAHTFLNDRYANRIDFAPYFQRKYVWIAKKLHISLRVFFWELKFPLLCYLMMEQKMK